MCGHPEAAVGIDEQAPQLQEIDGLVSSRLSPTLGYRESDAAIPADPDPQRAAAGAPAKGPAA